MTSLFERFRMKCSGHLFEGLYGTWTRTAGKIIVDLVHTSGKHSRRVAQSFGYVSVCFAHRAAGRQDDRVGTRCECRLITVLGPRAGNVGGNGERAGAAHEIRDKGIATCGVERFTRDLVKNSHRFFGLHCSFDSVCSLAKLLDQRFCLLAVVQHDTDLFDRAKDAVEVVWIGNKHRDVLVLELLSENLELRRG